jgi:hypothetical protein
VRPLSAGVPPVTCSLSSDTFTAFRIYRDTSSSTQTVHLVHFVRPRRQTSDFGDTDDMERVSLNYPVTPVPHGCATHHPVTLPAVPFAVSNQSLSLPNRNMKADSTGASCVDRSVDRARSKRRDRLEFALPFDFCSSATHAAWFHRTLQGEVIRLGPGAAYRHFSQLSRDEPVPPFESLL